MNFLLSRILSYINGTLLFDDNYKMCIFIINNYVRFEDVSEQEIIDTGIKKESITAFCSLFGFNNGFEEFKSVLVQHSLIRIDQIRARMLGEKSEKLISEMNKELSDEDMFNCMSDICAKIEKSRRIILVGAQFPMSLAVEFQTDLIVFGKPVIQFHSFDKTLKFDEHDMIIHISATGRSMKNFISSKQDLDISKSRNLLITQNKLYTHKDHKITDDTILVPGRFDGILFNYDILRIFDILRIHYYQQYYLR